MSKAKPSPKKVSLPLIQDDPWLSPYSEEVELRLQRYLDARSNIEDQYPNLAAYANAYTYFGIHYDRKAEGWWYREWAPAATALSLIGDFNQWDRNAHPLKKLEGGVWELFIPQAEANGLGHQSLVKVHVVGALGGQDRIPAYIQRAVQDPKTADFSGQIWAPAEAFAWTDADFVVDSGEAPLIYECHIGMAQEKEGVGTYREFADNILPRIHKLGYNTIQTMAIQEHPYYGSFGYHVSNFFAASSRFGTPEDLKYLIDKAHSMGIAVIMDIVHSHAVKNLAEGLNQFDGSDDQYFHPGGRGYHDGWDSKLFNYGKWEVQQFLLSNVAYWLKEYHFDGYRFDGVTSMLYFHHGMHVSFDSYDKYFREGVEWDAITYLQLANALIHETRPGALSIAEDMSGMPGACRKIMDGGLGFDYRLGMGIPDYWIKVLKHYRDEDWNLHEMWYTLTNRRWKEKTIAYAESHDQALVGDKTLAFWLMDQEMYWHMQVDDPHPVIDRGMALHKLIRFFTGSIGGEGYLNFIGNEFGHPEWIDFPREGNNESYQYARRQWSLVDREDLKYKYLNAFDAAFVHFMREEGLLSSLPARQLNVDTQNQVIVYERDNLIFVLNFHVNRSITDYKFNVPKAGSYQILLNTDAKELGGHGRIDNSVTHFTLPDKYDNPQLSLYVTNRTGLVLKRVE